MTDGTNEGRPPQKLGSLLRAARKRLRISQTETSARTGIAQSAISRMEQDPPGSVPTPAQAQALAEVYQLSDDWRDQLVLIAEEHLTNREVKRYVVLRGRNILHLQRRFRALEQDVIRLRSFSSGGILGQLQTPGYAGVVLHGKDDLVRERLARGVDSPENRDRQYEIVMTEGVAFPAFGSAAVMAAQFEHLVTVSQLPNVDLRWLGRGTVLSKPPLVRAFNIYDDHTLVINQADGSATLEDPEDVARYTAEFERLQAAAIRGDEVRAALAEIANWYRR